MCVCPSMHVCIRVLYTHLCSVYFFTACRRQTSEPVCSFHPVVSILCCRGGSGHQRLYWLSGLFLLAWLCFSVEALLGECGCMLDVFTPALADYRPNEIQIWLCWFRVWYWHPSRLHRAVTASLNPQNDVVIYSCRISINTQCQLMLAPWGHLCLHLSVCQLETLHTHTFTVFLLSTTHYDWLWCKCSSLNKICNSTSTYFNTK